MDREAWGHTRGCLNLWGCWGIRVVSKCMGTSKHMGVSRCPKHMGGQVNAPKCKSYMPLKKIRGVGTYGGVGGIRGASKHICIILVTTS